MRSRTPALRFRISGGLRSGRSGVAVVQAAEMGDGTDGVGATLDFARLGRVAFEREMAARTVVLLSVPAQDAAQVRFAQGDDVVKTLAPDAPDDPLDERVLPRRLLCVDDLRDAHRRDPLAEDIAVGGVAVSMRSGATNVDASCGFC